MGVVFVLCMKWCSVIRLYRCFLGSSVLTLPLKLLTEKSKIFILLGSIRDPLYLFLKRCYPQIQQSSVGGKVIRNTLGGGREGSRESQQKISTHASQGLRLESLGCTLSVTGAERTSPGMASSLSPMTRPHKQSSLPPGLGGNWGAKGSLLRDCSACKAPRGQEDGEYQKIVVSYLVLIPLLASCPGSTIHGRLAKVFCSDGSICFRTERLMPVIRYLYRGANMLPNTSWKPVLGPDRTAVLSQTNRYVRIVCLSFSFRFTA